MSLKGPPPHHPTPPPSEQFTAAFAARHVRTKHHTDCTRQTIHNWIKVGVKGEKLQARRIGHRWYTCKEWVDEFIADIAR